MSDSATEHTDKEALMTYLRFFPSGGSARSVLHFKQMLESGEFKKFDFGSARENLRRYGTPEPPHYDLKNIKDFHIRLVCGKADLLASPDDYNWLHEELLQNGNQIEFQETESGHSGLLFPKDRDVTSSILNSIIRS